MVKIWWCDFQLTVTVLSFDCNLAQEVDDTHKASGGVSAAVFDKSSKISFPIPGTQNCFRVSTCSGVFMSLKKPAVCLFEVSFCWVFVSPHKNQNQIGPADLRAMNAWLLVSWDSTTDIDFQWVFSGTLKGNSAAKPVMELKILGFPKAGFFLKRWNNFNFFGGIEGFLWIVERILLKSWCEFFFGGKMNKRQCI